MIHKTAIIDKKAEIESDVEIGAHVSIGPNVKIGKGVVIHHHASVDGWTEIGNDVKIFPYAALGGIPQDLKYKTGKCICRIGARTVLREFVTVNCGAEPGGATQVGEDCMLMAYSHLGHNVTIGKNVIIANAGSLAGHVVVDDYANIGGLVGIHQFVHVGRMVFIGGCSKVIKDLPPFMIVDGNPAEVRYINKIGLQRRGFSSDIIAKIRRAFKILYKSGLNFSQALERLSELGNDKEILEIINFIKNSHRGITRGER